MKRQEIIKGQYYKAKVNGNVVVVRVDDIRTLPPNRYSKKKVVYDVTNTKTGRKTVFHSATKFRESAKLSEARPKLTSETVKTPNAKRLEPPTKDVDIHTAVYEALDNYAGAVPHGVEDLLNQTVQEIVTSLKAYADGLENASDVLLESAVRDYIDSRGIALTILKEPDQPKTEYFPPTEPGWYKVYLIGHPDEPLVRYLKDGTSYFCDPAEWKDVQELVGAEASQICSGTITQYNKAERIL